MNCIEILNSLQVEERKEVRVIMGYWLIHNKKLMTEDPKLNLIADMLIELLILEKVNYEKLLSL
jgi:hypothetical protein